MMNQPAHIFLSYKSEDRRRLKPLVGALEAEGFSVWWDAQIGGGSHWREDIELNLERALCVIVAWSKRSSGPDGHFVRDEATRALHRGVYLPVTIDEVRLPLGFGETQALPLIGWKGDRKDLRFQMVVDAARSCISGGLIQPVRASLTTGEPRLSRRMMIAAGLGTATIAGIGGWAVLRSVAASASNRIAVMSFANLSGDPAQTYFSEGIAEELRGALSRIGMRVIGKASSDAVKDLDTGAVAEKLGVSNILTGSVRRSPQTIRVGAQLLDGHEGVVIWSQNYDRAPGDTIKIQSDIASEVAGALRIALGAAKKAALALGGTKDAKAQDLYLQAEHLGKAADSAEADRKTIALYDAALSRDPGYGDAYVAKAYALLNYGGQFSKTTVELREWQDQAERSTRRGSALMTGSGRPTAMFAQLSVYRLDYIHAVRAFDEALAASPDDTWVLERALKHLPWLVDGDPVLSIADRFVKLDPLNALAHLARGKCIFLGRNFKGSLRPYNQALALAPQRNFTRYLISSNLILLNRLGEARAMLASMGSYDVFRRTNEAILAVREADSVKARALIARIRADYGETSNFQCAQIFAQLGDAEGAFAALDQAISGATADLYFLKREPFLDPIRLDPRFAVLLKRLNFP
jgi:TolB-like protein